MGGRATGAAAAEGRGAGAPQGTPQGAAEGAPAGRAGRARRETEARILDAAEAVFAEAGFAGAAMQAIADRAGLPKANLHYYFGTKAALYRAVLARILDLWVDAFRHIEPESDPALALSAYIADKMQWSRTRPLASRVFANELLHGAPQVADYLSGKLRRTVDEKARVVEGWIAAGRMARVDPHHLFFLLWAATQTYADFEVQVRAVLGRDGPDSALDDATLDVAAREVTALVLRGCGLPPVHSRSAPPPPPSDPPEVPAQPSRR